MIHDVDETLRAWMRRDVLKDAKVDVAFETPNKEWAAKRQGPTLNFYLYDIREDLHRRRVMFEEVRDDDGKVVDRRQPPRKFKLSYLVTAWTQRPEDEHRLLSAALTCFVSQDILPTDLLHGGLPDVGEHVRLTVALPLPPERSISELWTALGGEMKPSLDLIVTTPFPAQVGRTQFIGPPVIEEPRISLVGPDGERDDAGGRPGKGAADPEDAEAVPEIVEAFRGGKPDSDGGRRFTIRTLPRPS